MVSETFVYDPSQPINLSPIQKFYKNCNIFITGGTGFLGKTLLQKLLSTCPEIETIYLMIRSKRGKDVHARVEEIFDDQIFEKMKEVCPKYRHIIQGVAGDCLLPGLGLSDQDRETLINKVNIVFHMAATVRFDEKLKISMQINVKACKDVLDLCRQMRHLKSVIHVSTAYTQCPSTIVEERFYPPPIDSKKMLTLAECLSEKFLDNITPMLLNKWPNTYTFTKAIAEDIVRQHSVGLPVGMVRPGIVISTFREPVVGWIDNFYGPTGVIAGAGTGILRTLRCDPNKSANMVPVDLCVNAILSAAWDVYEKHNIKIEYEPSTSIYNYCTVKQNLITWGGFTDKTTKYGLLYPSIKAIWYVCYRNNPSKILHFLWLVFLHYVPAILMDMVALIIGKKPRMLRTYKKIHKFMGVIEYFSMREWDFEVVNTMGLWDRMSAQDRKLFYFDMRKLDWDGFLKNYFRGVRLYLLKDPFETVPDALVKWKRLYWLHQLVKLITVVLVIKMIWPIVRLFL